MISIWGVAGAILVLLMHHAYYTLLKLRRVEKYDLITPFETTSNETENQQHDVHSAFMRLYELDGAGAWPPKTDHEEWPLPLRPYREVYTRMSPAFATADPSDDDEWNNKLRTEFRIRMRALLASRIDLDAVEDILSRAEAEVDDGPDDKPSLSREAYNAFYACIACSRHMYRWATNPVVRVAQDEKLIDFPRELVVPWRYLKRRFGITSPSGNIMSNAVLNLDEQDRLRYTLTEDMPEVVVKTELEWCRLFRDVESMAIPIYGAITQAIISFEQGDKAACLAHTETMQEYMRQLMRALTPRMGEPTLARSVWSRYAAGVSGWAATEESETGPVEYGGLSGSQLLFYPVMDAFLDVDPYHSSEDEAQRHTSKNMRHVCATVAAHSFRRKLSSEKPEDVAIKEVLEQAVKRIRRFRAAHRERAVQYLSVSLHERAPMTAALSVLAPPKKQSKEMDVFEPVREMLDKRLKQTM